MRLQFKILWFENQPKEVKPATDALRSRLDEHGFELELQMERDDSNLALLALDQERYHEFDLVVVDFDLGQQSEKGDVVARRIRNSFGFTDIIFYSGSKTEDLRQRVKDQAIDGVYCMPRNELRASLLERVEDVVRRMSRLEAMRGLAVVTGGRGDVHLRSILRHIHVNLDEAEQADLISTIDDEVSATADRNRARYGKLKDLDGRLADFACTSMALLRGARKFVDRHPELRAEAEILAQYQAEVIETRNKFGHLIETKTDEGWALVGKAPPPITHEDFPAFRRNYLRQLKNLASIEAIVAGQQKVS